MRVIIFETIFKRNKIEFATQFVNKLTLIDELKFIVMFEDHQRILYQFIATLTYIATPF